MMDSIKFRYLLNIEVDKNLETRLMDVYGSLNIVLYIYAEPRRVGRISTLSKTTTMP